MRKIIKCFFSIFIVFAFLFSIIKVNAETHNANDDVNLGKYNIYYRKGASYIRYNGVGQLNYLYFYKDYNGVEHKAFCLNLGTPGAEEGDYKVDANKLIQDPKVAGILISGSPYRTLQELGLSSEDEAQYATQFAVWAYLKPLDLNKIAPYTAGNQKHINVVNAIKKIYNDGIALSNHYTSEALLHINKVGKADIDDKNRECYSQKYTISKNENVKNVSLSTMGIDNVKIVDMNNNVINDINNVSEFKVLIPNKSVTENKELLLNFRVESKQTSVMFGATTVNNRQNMGLLLDPVNLKSIQDRFTVEYKTSNIKLKKIDKDTGEPVANVKFRFETLEGENLGEFKTNDKGIIELDVQKDLNVFKEQQIKVTEIEVPDNYYIDEKNSTKVIDIIWGENVNIEFQNEKIKGKIKILKLSSSDNKYTSIVAKCPLKDVVFEIYDMENNLVDTVTTNEDGIAVTKDLLKGKYKFKEVKQAKYYLLNENIFEVEIQTHNQVIEQVVYNDSVNIDIEIKKYGFIETQNKDNIYYNFKDIHNKSNVPLDNFTWNDTLPKEVRLDKIYTGTWNEKLEYEVWYKTNKNDFKLYKDKLDSETVYELNFNNIGLSDNEYITEFEFRFGTVKVDFQEIESPIVYVNIVDNLKNGYKFINNTRVSGDYLEEHIEDKDKWITIIYNRKVNKSKELPKTR